MIATAIVSVLFVGLLFIFILYILHKNDTRNLLDIENEIITSKQNYKEIKDFAIYTTNQNKKFIAHKCRFDIGDKTNKDLPPPPPHDEYIDFI
jgi:hypothetical protein